MFLHLFGSVLGLGAMAVPVVAVPVVIMTVPVMIMAVPVVVMAVSMAVLRWKIYNIFFKDFVLINSGVFVGCPAGKKYVYV